MAARVRVNLIELGMFKLVNDAGVGRELTRRAELIAAEARAIAPVDRGDYKRSIHVISDHSAVTIYMRRRARVASSDPAAVFIEAQHGTLARSLHAGGVVAKVYE